MTALSPDQTARFHHDGFLVLPDVFSPAELAVFHDESDFLIELLVNAADFHQRRSGRLDLIVQADGGAMVRKIQPINDLSVPLAAMSRDARLLDPLRELMGDEPQLMEEKLNTKQAVGGLPDICHPRHDRADDRFPIHNDWAYYAHNGYPQTIISTAVALDDCTVDNGPLRIWPGSHTVHREHDVIPDLGLQVRPDLIDHDGGEDLLMTAGSVVFFHTLLVHNSRPNCSGDPRRLMIYSHVPKGAGMPADARNGGGRMREAPYEIAYLRAKAEGRHQDRFRLARHPTMAGV